LGGYALNQRHWLNIVKPYLQLKFLTIMLFAVLVNVAVLGAFTWYIFNQLVQKTSVEPEVWETLASELFVGGVVIGMIALAITFLMVYVLFRELNRVVGPIYRISQELRSIHETGEVHPISVRSNDHFQSMVKKLNLVLLDLSQNPSPE
jgi:uncharacterized membrane protein YciS (DUF1049 family)